jgi:hypothetical protein
VPRLGDLSIDMTYRAVGHALTAWEKFERELAEIFSFLAAKRFRYLPAMRAYGSILTLRGRIDLLKTASEAVLAEKPNKVFRLRLASLLDGATNFGSRRNEIAHGVVMRYRNLRTDPRSYVLAPNFLSTNKFKFPKAEQSESGEIATLRAAYIYSSVELDAFAEQFDRLRTEAIAVTKIASHHVLKS